MRVLYVSPYPPAVDGIGDYTAALAAEVRGRGHDVAVIAATPSESPPAEVIAALSLSPFALGPVRDAVREFDPDVVHVQFGVAAFATRVGSLLALLRALSGGRATIVVTFHEVLRDTALLRGPGRALYRRVALRADHALLHTTAAMHALQSIMGSPADSAAVVPHPRRDLPAASVAPDELLRRHGLLGRQVLLAFGFIHIDKGLGDLVDALALLRDRHPEAFGSLALAVAGDVRRRSGPFRVFELGDRLHLAAVRRRIARHGLGDRVHFTGYVPAGEISAWFGSAQAAVLPYRRIDQSGVATLAAAARRPVLLSRAGGLTEGLAGSARWTYPPRDPDRLAEVLASFLLASDAARADAVAPPTSAPDLATYVTDTLALYRRNHGPDDAHALAA